MGRGFSMGGHGGAGGSEEAEAAMVVSEVMTMPLSRMKKSPHVGGSGNRNSLAVSQRLLKP